MRRPGFNKWVHILSPNWFIICSFLTIYLMFFLSFLLKTIAAAFCSVPWAYMQNSQIFRLAWLLKIIDVTFIWRKFLSLPLLLFFYVWKNHNDPCSPCHRKAGSKRIKPLGKELFLSSKQRPRKSLRNTCRAL